MPESFWKGAFLPVQKHVTSIQFTSLNQMTNDDWNVLDYEALRPEPKNRLADSIVNGELKGFYAVDVDLHKAKSHGGKPKYFYPAKTAAGFESEYGELDFGSSVENDDDIEPSAGSRRMDDLMFWLGAYVTVETAQAIMDKLAKEDSVPYEEFDNSEELLEIRHKMLLIAIGLFATDPAKARAILRSVDILDDEVYAALNDEEPTE